jgi:hypothetical protein
VASRPNESEECSGGATPGSYSASPLVTRRHVEIELGRPGQTWSYLPPPTSGVSVGVTAWVGSLPNNGYDDNISRIPEHVLDRS